MSKIKLIILIWVVLLSSPAYAAIKNFDLEFNIVYNKVHVDNTILFDNRVNYTIKLPADAKATSLWLDDVLQEKQIINKEFSVLAKKIRVSYLTNEYLDRQNFLIDLIFPDDIKNLSIRLVLPEDTRLAKPINYETLASNAVFPKPTRLETDGQRLIVTWERNNVKKGDSMSILVIFKKATNILLWIIPLIILVAALTAYIIFKKPRIKKVVEKVTIKAEIEKHLKEDEAQIIRILKQREGCCEQGTLRVITGFSKAKLSGILKELEERKIIYKEKRGKKNLVFLKK